MKLTDLLEDVYTVKEVADYLRIDPDTVYQAINDGRLKAIRPSQRTVRVTEAQLCEYVSVGRKRPLPRDVNRQDMLALIDGLAQMLEKTVEELQPLRDYLTYTDDSGGSIFLKHLDLDTPTRPYAYEDDDDDLEY